MQSRSQSARELDSWHDVIGVSAEPWGGRNSAAASTAASVVASAAAAPAEAEGSARVSPDSLNLLIQHISSKCCAIYDAEQE
ncbi:unnamed protein product, partial [Closterium sp. NIES-53]